MLEQPDTTDQTAVTTARGLSSSRLRAVTEPIKAIAVAALVISSSTFGSVANAAADGVSPAADPNSALVIQENKGAGVLSEQQLSAEIQTKVQTLVTDNQDLVSLASEQMSSTPELREFLEQKIGSSLATFDSDTSQFDSRISPGTSGGLKVELTERQLQRDTAGNPTEDLSGLIVTTDFTVSADQQVGELAQTTSRFSGITFTKQGELNSYETQFERQGEARDTYAFSVPETGVTDFFLGGGFVSTVIEQTEGRRFEFSGGAVGSLDVVNLYQRDQGEANLAISLSGSTLSLHDGKVKIDLTNVEQISYYGSTISTSASPEELTAFLTDTFAARLAKDIELDAREAARTADYPEWAR